MHAQNLNEIIKIQAFCRGVLARMCVLRSKQEFLEIFQNIEESNSNLYQDFSNINKKENIWVTSPKPLFPKFGFSMNQEKNNLRKFELMDRIRLLTDKLEMVNQKMVDRKIELGLFD